MQKLSVAALAVAILGIVVALVAFLGTPEGAEGVRGELEEVTANLDQLERRIDKFRGELKQVSAARSEVPAEVQELSGKVKELSDRTARLDKALADLAARPAAAAGATAGIDQAKLQELVRNAMRAQFERMRRGRGGPGGGRTRVALAQVPQVVKDAALKALKGFAIDDVVRTTRDGKPIFEVDGKAEGKPYEIKVTPEGKVIDVDLERPRGGRGRGRRPPQRTGGGGDRPQPGTTQEPEPF
jgi:hypothetical protein